MKPFHLLLCVLVSAVVAFATVRFTASGTGAATVAESVYARVLRTGVLRCGYAEQPPYFFVKDPKTGKISGIAADATEAVAALLHLRVEWSEDTGWGGAVAALRSHRVDAFCAGLARNAERGRYIAYGTPLFYSPIYAYVNAADHRFDGLAGDMAALNKPDIRISSMDGELTDLIITAHFPKATKISVPQSGQLTDVLINVTTHKADIVFQEPSFVNAYITANPGSLRLLNPKPFIVTQSALAVDIHETPLRDMLDSALDDLKNQGVLDAIISRYTTDPALFLRVATPYR